MISRNTTNRMCNKLDRHLGLNFRPVQINIVSTLYEGISKSLRTMHITRKSLVVHEFPARVCCGSVL